MSIELGPYTFEGPYPLAASLKDRSGIYAILGKDALSGKSSVLDIGESSEVRTRVENHDRRSCWRQHTNGRYEVLKYAVYYTPGMHQEGRRRIESTLRALLDPPCGSS